VSEDAYRQVKTRLEIAVSDLGATKLKNIADPVHAYSLQVGLTDQAKATAPVMAAPEKMPGPAVPRDRPSIAVLAFQNMSGDPEQEYFADGIAEDVITDLSKISDLVVIARNSSFTYKGRPVDIRTVARARRPLSP
jgi:adenylate cyclase